MLVSPTLISHIKTHTTDEHHHYHTLAIHNQALFRMQSSESQAIATTKVESVDPDASQTVKQAFDQWKLDCDKFLESGRKRTWEARAQFYEAYPTDDSESSDEDLSEEGNTAHTAITEGGDLVSSGQKSENNSKLSVTEISAAENIQNHIAQYQYALDGLYGVRQSRAPEPEKLRDMFNVGRSAMRELRA